MRGLASISAGARLHHFAHPVVNDQPAVPGHDGRRASTDFEPLPGRHGSRQPVVTGKLAEVIWFTALQGHGAVRNPDAFPVEIHLTGSGVAGGFLGTGAGKERPVEHGQFRLPGWIRDGDGEEAGVFVIHVADIRCPDTGRRSRAPDAANGRGPPIWPGRSVGLGAKTPYKSSCSAGAVPRT